MALTPRQLAWVTSELGSDVDQTLVEEKFVRLASVRDVVLEVLRDRINTLVRSPLSVSLQGVASVNQTENVKSLERQIERVAKLDDDPTDEPGEIAENDRGVVVDPPFRLVRSRGR